MCSFRYKKVVWKSQPYDFRRPSQPAVAWASPTKNNAIYLPTRKPSDQLRGQSHATIRSRHHNALPATSLGLPIRKSCLFSLDSLYSTIKIKKSRLKPIITWIQTTFSHIPGTRYDAV